MRGRAGPASLHAPRASSTRPAQRTRTPAAAGQHLLYMSLNAEISFLAAATAFCSSALFRPIVARGSSPSASPVALQQSRLQRRTSKLHVPAGSFFPTNLFFLLIPTANFAQNSAILQIPHEQTTFSMYICVEILRNLTWAEERERRREARERTDRSAARWSPTASRKPRPRSCCGG